MRSVLVVACPMPPRPTLPQHRTDIDVFECAQILYRPMSMDVGWNPFIGMGFAATSQCFTVPTSRRDLTIPSNCELCERARSCCMGMGSQDAPHAKRHARNSTIDSSPKLLCESAHRTQRSASQPGSRSRQQPKRKAEAHRSNWHKTRFEATVSDTVILFDGRNATLRCPPSLRSYCDICQGAWATVSEGSAARKNRID